MDAGDIFWVDFPSGAGRAQAGRRPAIILQSAEHEARLPTTILIPLTSKQDALRFPGTILIEPDEDNGLNVASIALVFQITAVDKRFILNQAGRVSREVLQDIHAALEDLIR